MPASFVAGDTGSKLRITCKDNDTGAAIDLTGSTVRIKWNDADGTLVTKVMTHVTPVSGIAEYQFATGELFADRFVHYEVEITDATGKVLRNLELLTEDVREALA